GDYPVEIEPHKTHFFPDFVVEGENKLLEVGDTEHWHTLQEIQDRVRAYATVGYACLYLTGDEIKQNPEEARAKVLAYVYNHDVPIDAISRPKSGMHSQYRYTIDVHEYHGYFANGVLVANYC